MRAPILFLVTQAVNVLEVVTEFHIKKASSLGGARLLNFSLGEGMEESVVARLEQAAQGGDWVVLENLHLVPHWLPSLEALLESWTGPEIHSRFRLWASAVPGSVMPTGLLEKSVKVALLPPKSIKQKMEKMLNT